MPRKNRNKDLVRRRERNSRTGIVEPYRRRRTRERGTDEDAATESPLGDDNNQQQHTGSRSWLPHPLVTRLSCPALLPAIVAGLLVNEVGRLLFPEFPPMLGILAEGLLQFVDQVRILSIHVCSTILFIYKWFFILDRALRGLRSLGKYILIAWSIGS